MIYIPSTSHSNPHPPFYAMKVRRLCVDIALSTYIFPASGLLGLYSSIGI